MKAKAYVRTTVDIPTPLYRQLRQRAAKENSSIKSLVLRGIQEALKESAPAEQKRIRLPLIKSDKPGTLDLTNEQIYEIIGFP